MTASSVLQDYIFTSKYARYIESESRRETWHEAVNRVRDMMLTKYEDKGIKDRIVWAYDMMRKKRVLGSQRALQFGGEPAFKKNARVFNCVASYCDRLRFFQEYFWLLLCGCGAGFSVQKHHVAKLPELQSNLVTKVTRVYTIPDTIEGWADSIGVLLTTYFQQPADPKFADWLNYNVEFDYSNIRPKGSPLSSGVGKAPGPDGLRETHIAVRKVLDAAFNRSMYESRKLRPIECYDIAMHISEAVLSGGVRRSATIALFSPDDDEMAKAKIGDWMRENPQRARSNNSALLVRNKTSKEQFEKLMDLVKEWGEPGFVWADSPEFVVNPCVEIGFFTYDIIDVVKFGAWRAEHPCDAITCDPAEIGLKTGWQGCNLTTCNCTMLKGTPEEKKKQFLENVEAAAIIGTCQAGFTEMDYLGQTSRNIFEREALLGVSMTGMMDNFEVVLDPAVQREAAELVLKVNAEIALAIGINLCARGCCLKPEGTGTLILGSSAHGCHPHHYIRYLRAVQANKDETIYQFFKNHNPQACEECRWSSSGTDDVIYFPIEVPDGAKTMNQIPAVELLKIVKSTQENWVMAGRREALCVMPWLNHNVSNTVTVRPNEWSEVIDFVYDNKEFFAGISFVPDSADKDYPQAPNCAVYTPRQIVKEYGDAALWTSGLIELGLEAFNGDLWAACSAIMKSNYSPLDDKDISLDKADDLRLAGRRKNFHQKATKFALRYFNGDVRRLNYCMKDVFNWKRWYDLSKTLSEVDYTQCIENEDNTKLEQNVACAGGVCTLV